MHLIAVRPAVLHPSLLQHDGFAGNAVRQVCAAADVVGQEPGVALRLGAPVLGKQLQIEGDSGSPQTHDVQAAVLYSWL